LSISANGNHLINSTQIKWIELYEFPLDWNFDLADFGLKLFSLNKKGSLKDYQFCQKACKDKKNKQINRNTLARTAICDLKALVEPELGELG
jgi:hypothetical protein